MDASECVAADLALFSFGPSALRRMIYYRFAHHAKADTPLPDRAGVSQYVRPRVCFPAPREPRASVHLSLCSRKIRGCTSVSGYSMLIGWCLRTQSRRDEFMKWATGTPGFMTGLRPDELEDSLRAFYLSTGTPTMSKRPWKQMLQNVFLYHRFLAATKSQMLAGRDGVENRGVRLEIHLIASLYGRK